MSWQFDGRVGLTVMATIDPIEGEVSKGWHFKTATAQVVFSLAGLVRKEDAIGWESRWAGFHELPVNPLSTIS